MPIVGRHRQRNAVTGVRSSQLWRPGNSMGRVLSSCDKQGVIWTPRVQRYAAALFFSFFRRIAGGCCQGAGQGSGIPAYSRSLQSSGGRCPRVNCLASGVAVTACPYCCARFPYNRVTGLWERGGLPTQLTRDLTDLAIGGGRHPCHGQMLLTVGGRSIFECRARYSYCEPFRHLLSSPACVALLTFLCSS